MEVKTREEVQDKIKRLKEDLIESGWDDVLEVRYEQTGRTPLEVYAAVTEQLQTVAPRKVLFVTDEAFQGYGVPRIFMTRLGVPFPLTTYLISTGHRAEEGSPENELSKELMSIVATEGGDAAEEAAQRIVSSSDTKVPEIHRAILVILVPVKKA